MSFVSKMKSLPGNLPHGTAKKGFGGFLMDKGERYAAAAIFGYSKGHFGEKFLYKDHGLDLWIGAGATLLAGVIDTFTSDKYDAACHLERIGDAGMMSAIGSLAAAYGMEKAGRSVAVLSPGKNVSSLPGKKTSVVGSIAPAMGASYLNAQDIARWANRR